MAEFSILRDNVYSFIISQLMYDGLHNFAQSLSSVVGLDAQLIRPSCELYKICVAKLNEDSLDKRFNHTGKNFDTDLREIEKENAMIIDRQLENMKSYVPTFHHNDYETVYVTSHKGPCVVATFSKDGKYIATGSTDTSIKILDTNKMIIKASETKLEKQLTQTDHFKDEEINTSQKNHPVLRTLYDHLAPVSCLDFHPSKNMLMSGSLDCYIHFFDLSVSSTKKAIKSLHEVQPITKLTYHPSGDYFITSCISPTIRYYDIQTFSCFISSNSSDQHLDTVSFLKFVPNGKVFISGSMDGNIKIWDGVSNKCIKTILGAHQGRPIKGLELKSDDYTILTTGQDNKIRLWDMRNYNNFLEIDSFEQFYENENAAVFNHTEDYIFYVENKNMNIACCDSKTGEKLGVIPSGHTDVIRQIIHSPTEAALMTCSNDFRSRYWYAGEY